MQIGTSFQTSALAVLRQAGGDDTTRRAAQGRGSGERRHSHDRVRDSGATDGGSAEARLQGRMQKLSAMLQRLTEGNPDAAGASFAAIVLGGSGATAVASTSGAGQAGDRLVIQADEISDVTTGSGNDTVQLQGGRVTGIYTGGGSDALAIVGTFVSGIHMGEAGPPPPAPPPGPPPAPPPAPPVVADTVAGDALAGVTLAGVTLAGETLAGETLAGETLAGVTLVGDTSPGDTLAGGADGGSVVDTSGSAAAPLVSTAPVVAGNDALSIAAYLINDISTGGGDDAVALVGRIVSNVDAGSGDDAVAISAQVVSGVTGGDGNDAIAADAGVGVAGVSNAEAWFAQAAAVAANGDAFAAVGAAAKAYADVDGGAGNDVISVGTRSVLAVAGGTGDDTINALDGTVSLVYGAGDGNDTVNVAAGAQVVLQIADDAGPYSVEFGAEGTTVRMGEGSVTFKGIGAGTIGIKQGDGGMALISAPGAGGLRLVV